MHRSMMQVYVKESARAIDFYLNAFDAKQVCRYQNDDGTIAHAELDIYGQIFAICEQPESAAITGNTMQFCLHFGEGKEELVKKIIENLSDGGRFDYHGRTDWSPLMASIVDKFGVNWCVFV